MSDGRRAAMSSELDERTVDGLVPGDLVLEFGSPRVMNQLSALEWQECCFVFLGRTGCTPARAGLTSVRFVILTHRGKKVLEVLECFRFGILA